MNNRSRFFRNAAVILLALILIGGYFYWKKGAPSQPENGVIQREREKGKSGRRQLPIAPVQVAVVRIEDVPQYLTGLGTLVATNTATVRSPVSGQLIAIHFKEGQTVKQGQLLAELDPRPFEVALSQAQGQLARDQATLTNAQRDVVRYEKLAKTRLVSDQELDTKRSLVAQTLGSIKTGEANVASAKLNLTYSRITAPISGRTGLKQVDIGNYISSGDAKGIVIITQSDPIDMLFSLPESTIPAIIQAKKNQSSLLVEAWDRSNEHLLARGKLLTLDNQIDTTTGTIKLKARFDNKEEKLFSHQFVNARLKIDTLKNAIVIPNSALQMGSEGNFVWMLDKDNKVSKKAVTSLFQDKEKVVIAAGLNAGERVVTDGLDRLTEGAKVEVISPQNQDTPAATANIGVSD